MNVRLLSISTVLLLLLGVATTRVSATDPQNVDKMTAREKSDAGEPAGKPSGAQIQTPSIESGETPEPVSPTQKELADSLIAALKSKDLSRLKALIAPQSLECFDKTRQPYLDSWFRRQFSIPNRQRLPANRRQAGAGYFQ
jgi:hypothetical protein